VLSGPAFAKPFTKVVNLSLPGYRRRASGPGDYWVTVDRNKVTIVQDHKVVAKPKDACSRDPRQRSDHHCPEADGQLKEIHFDGGNQVLVMKSES